MATLMTQQQQPVVVSFAQPYIKHRPALLLLRTRATMSNIEKRKPFSPVDGKRLLQQQNKRPPKGHRRGKANGSTTKTHSIKDENSSLASLVDDTGFDFLTNPKPETIPQQQSLQSFWSSTSKTPKISNVTLLKLKSAVLGVNPKENTTNPPLPPTAVANAKPTKQMLPAPPPKSHPLTKRGPEHSTQKKHAKNTHSLETIIEGTPEQERESPPPPQPINLAKEFGTATPTTTGYNSNVTSTNQAKASSRNVPSEMDHQQFHSDNKQDEEEEETANTGSDMDENSDDDLMNLTLSPPPPQNAENPPERTNQVQLPEDIGKPPLSTNHPVRSQRAPEVLHVASQIPGHPDPWHTPRSHQELAPKNTPHPAVSLPIPPRMHHRPPKVELKPMHSLNKEKNDRKTANESKAVDIPNIHRKKDRPGKLNHTEKVESLTTSNIEAERQQKPIKNKSDNGIERLDISNCKSNQQEAVTATTQGFSDFHTRDLESPTMQIPMKPSNRRSKQPIELAKMDDETPEHDIANTNQLNNQGNHKGIARDEPVPNPKKNPQIPPKPQDHRSNGKKTEQVHSAVQREVVKEFSPKTSIKGKEIENKPKIHPEATGKTIESPIANQKPRLSRHQQNVNMQNTEPETSQELQPSNDSTVPFGKTNHIHQVNPEQRSRLQIKQDEKTETYANIGSTRDGTKIYNLPRKDQKRTIAEPINKEVWQAMMAPSGEVKKDKTGLLGLVIETPDHEDAIVDAKSVDESELTQDTFFLLDRVLQRTANQSHCLQQSSPMREESALPIDLDCTKSTTKTQNINMKERSEHKASSHRDAENNKINMNQPGITATPLAKQHHIHSPPTVLPFTHDDLTVQRRGNSIDALTNNKPQIHDVNQFVRTPNSTVHFSTPFPKLHTKGTSTIDIIGSVSTSGGCMLRLIQDEVYSEILSSVTKNVASKESLPTLWTSELAGSKIKALGVNAAPVFRLDDGKYFRHPPLPPGWTIAISRSHNLPFYIHPDFGATFYSPVPLPSMDGKVQGTTLLYQADTPKFRKTVNADPGSQAATTPIIFGLTSSSKYNTKTSSVATDRFELAMKETPVGALIVATNDQFSEMNFGGPETAQIPPTETPSPIIRQDGEHSPPTSSPPKEKSMSHDSTSTVTMASSHQHLKGGIPTEIEIFHHNDVAEDEKFQIHLDATAVSERYVSPVLLCESTQGKRSNDIVLENKSAHLESESPASMDSKDASLDWVVGIPSESRESEMTISPKQSTDEVVLLHQNQSDPKTPNKYSRITSNKASSCHSRRQSVDSRNSDDIPFPMDDYDLSPPIPQRVIVGEDFAGDDMSLLQCTPLQQGKKATISSRFEPIPTSLIDIRSTLINGGQDDADYEQHSQHSANSRSYASIQSGLSRASHRALHPLLPLCSLQNIQLFIDKQQSEKKRKKSGKVKRAKRPRTVLTVPISA